FLLSTSPHPTQICTLSLHDALPISEAFVTLVAVIVCIPAWVPGVNNPAALIVPVVEFPPLFPSTCQVTPALFGSLKAVPVNCCRSEERRVGVGGWGVWR